MNRQWNTVVVTVGLVMLAACTRTMPVHNVPDTTVVVAPGAQGEAVIRDAIIAAGRVKGWRMNPVAPGHIVGTVNVRDHEASVDVHYDSDSYSIQYRDSTNLLYDGSSIHRNYNKWVILLDRQIQLSLP